MIGLVDGRDQVRDIFGQGANFIVYKPVSEERAGSSLRAARGLMAREKRSKLRVALHAPASIAYGSAENVPATLLDLSEDGLAIQSERRLPLRCKVYFQFNLPGGKSAVRLSGDVVWQDSSGPSGNPLCRRAPDFETNSERVDQGKSRQAGDRGTIAPKRCTESPSGDSGHTARGIGAFSFVIEPPRAVTAACRLSADVFRLGEGVPNRCTLSDISNGGCYVETPAPFRRQPW